MTFVGAAFAVATVLRPVAASASPCPPTGTID
jgi:hypothetical protein